MVNLAQITGYALNQLGKPYIWGSMGPDAFDCSGLVKAAWARVGIELPHNSGEQFRATKPVFLNKLNPLMPGDLVFYYGNMAKRRDPSHVGLYLGEHQGVHYSVQATQPGIDLEVIRMTEYAKPSSYGRPVYPGYNAKHKVTIYTP